MTTQMIIALAITALMVILIMQDKLPFGAPPLLACLLLVVFGIADIKAAFAGFSNATIIMLAEFMAIIAALQKTSFIARFKETMFNMANKGGIKAYIMMILVVMLGCSLFGTGFALAGKGTSNELSLVNAIDYAVRMAKGRSGNAGR